MSGVAGRSGRKPEPRENLVRRGSLKPTDVAWVPEVISSPEIPDPARPLGKVGQALWDHVWTTGGTWLKLADAELALIAAELADERQMYRSRLLRDDPDSWRSSIQARRCETQTISILTELGFSPSGRARLGLAVIEVERRLAKVTEGRASTPSEF